MMTTKTNNVRGESSHHSTTMTRMKMSSTDLINPPTTTTTTTTKQTAETIMNQNIQTNHDGASSSSPRTKRNILLRHRHRTKTTAGSIDKNDINSSPPFVPFPTSLELEPDDEIIENGNEVAVEKKDKCSVIDLEHELRQNLSPTEWMSFNMKHSVAGRMLLSHSSNRHQSLLLFRGTSSRSSTTDNSNKLHKSEPIINFTYHGGQSSSSSIRPNNEDHHDHRRTLGLPHSCRHLFSKRSHSLRGEVEEDKECSSQVAPTNNLLHHHDVKYTRSEQQQQQHDKQLLHKSLNDLLYEQKRCCKVEDSSSNDEELSDSDDNLEQALYETRQHNLERNSPNGPSCRQIIYSTCSKRTSSYSLPSSRHRHVDRSSSSLHDT